MIRKPVPIHNRIRFKTMTFRATLPFVWLWASGEWWSVGKGKRVFGTNLTYSGLRSSSQQIDDVLEMHGTLCDAWPGFIDYLFDHIEPNKRAERARIYAFGIDYMTGWFCASSCIVWWPTVRNVANGEWEEDINAMCLRYIASYWNFATPQIANIMVYYAGLCAYLIVVYRGWILARGAICRRSPGRRLVTTATTVRRPVGCVCGRRVGVSRRCCRPGAAGRGALHRVVVLAEAGWQYSAGIVRIVVRLRWFARRLVRTGAATAGPSGTASRWLSLAPGRRVQHTDALLVNQLRRFARELGASHCVVDSLRPPGWWSQFFLHLFTLFVMYIWCIHLYSNHPSSTLHLIWLLLGDTGREVCSVVLMRWMTNDENALFFASTRLARRSSTFKNNTTKQIKYTRKYTNADKRLSSALNLSSYVFTLSRTKKQQQPNAHFIQCSLLYGVSKMCEWRRCCRWWWWMITRSAVVVDADDDDHDDRTMCVVRK